MLLMSQVFALVLLPLGLPVNMEAGQLQQDAKPKIFKRSAPRKVAEVSPLEVKVQAVTTTAPTPSGTVSVVTLDLNQPTEFGTGITEMLLTELVKSDHFVVLDRLAGSSPGTGSLIPQITVKGAITELKLKRAGAGVGGKVGEQGSFSEAKVEATVGVDLRIVEVSTGRILDSFFAQGKATSRRKTFTFSKEELSFGTASFEEGALGAAVRDAIKLAVEGIVARAEKVEWEAKVVELEDSDDGLQIYLNVGVKAGLSAGMILDVRHAGKIITDPETNVVIGRTKGKKVGKLKVLEVSDQVTICVPVDGAGFEKSDVVTLSKGVEQGSKK
jgi:curli biogenesis system outer membrane secretion channel CsgG